MKVLVEGQLETRKWTDQSSNDRYTTEVVLRAYKGELIICEKAKRNGADAGDAPAGNGRSAPASGVVTVGRRDRF